MLRNNDQQSVINITKYHDRTNGLLNQWVFLKLWQFSSFINVIHYHLINIMNACSFQFPLCLCYTQTVPAQTWNILCVHRCSMSSIQCWCTSCCIIDTRSQEKSCHCGYKDDTVCMQEEEQKPVCVEDLLALCTDPKTVWNTFLSRSLTVWLLQNPGCPHLL